MKILKKIWLFLLLTVSFNLTAESLNFITDRYLYVAGETVNIYGKIKVNDNEKPSTIVYADIISPDYEFISKTKLHASDSYFQGQLKIPDYVKTSVCMIRVYTKFMRNSHIKYSYLKIINPDFHEVLKPENIANIELEKYNANLQTNFRQNKRSYQQSEKVEISINIKSKGFLIIKPEILKLTYPLLQYNSIHSDEKMLPKEINNFIISGKCITENDNLKHIKVNFSIIGEKTYQSVYTDSLGNFNFKTFYYQGEKQLYFYAKKAKILINNDFAAIPADLEFPEFNINKSEETVLLSLINNSKIAAQYFEKDTLKMKYDYNKFYGKADEQVFLYDYVDMENLVDYFNEIPGLVNVENEKSDNPIFKMRSRDPKIGYYRPLVLVNYLQINNNKKILEVSPKIIEKIEVINSVYIKDNFYYGGIINFITKGGKFDNSVLPENSVIVNYNFFDFYTKVANIQDYPFDFNSYSKNIDNELKLEIIAGKRSMIAEVFYYDEENKLNYFERKIRVNSK